MNIADMPKQFLALGDRPIVIRTLDKFMQCERLDHIYIGVHKDWVDHMNALIAQYFPEAQAKITTVVGGADRNGTIQNIVECLEAEHGENDEHIIVTHDSVRPFLSVRMIEENIDAAMRYGAVDTVVGAIDTIVVSDNGKTITEIPDRTRMYQGQTPQSFRVCDLKRLYASLTEEEKKILTDACKICVIRDYPVYLVEGSGSNIKITTPADYQIAKAMVESGAVI